MEIESDGRITNVWVSTDEGRVKLDGIIDLEFKQSADTNTILTLKLVNSSMAVTAQFENMRMERTNR